MTSNSCADNPNLVDEPGMAHILRVTLVAILVSALAFSALTLFLRWRLAPQLSLVVAAASLVGLVLNRSGRRRPAMLLPLLTITYVVLHLAARSGGIENIGHAIIPLLIVVCSLLLDGVTLVFFTAGEILAVAGMLAIRYFVLRAERFTTNDMGDLFIFALTCATAALVGRLLSVRIQESFRLVRASEIRYRRIFENIQDVYFEMCSDGTLLELSPSGTGLFGAPREHLIGQSLAPFVVNQSGLAALLAAVRIHGHVSNHELTIRDSHERLVHLLVSASLQTGPETGKERERMIGSIRDITDWRRAEEALRESESRLRLALEATGAGTFDFYPQSEKLIWSDITKAHFGMSPQTEVDHDMFLRAVHPDDRERVRQTAASVALAGSGGQLATEYRVIGVEDGKTRWLAVRGRMQFDAWNQPVRLIGTTLDISERKRLEEELRRRAEELQKIMDCAPVALFVAHDPECREVTTNRAANAMLELPEGANSPSAPGGSTPPVPFFRDGIEVPAHEQPLQTAARGVEVRDAELEVLLPSGRRRLLWGHATPLRDALGRVRGAVGAAQDITEARLRTDALLRESEERFRDTADAAPVIIWFGDTEKRLTFVNKQTTLFTGVPADQLLGDGWGQVIHPDDLEMARAVYYESVDSRASYQLEYRARRADGEYRQMLATTRPRYVGREYVGQVGSVIDITDLKRRQEEDFARQKLESVGMLAGGIAHDFNNLLGAVLAQADLALLELATGSHPEEELQRIRDVAIQGAQIVRQLMIYAGKESEELELIDVSQIIKEMVDLLKVSVSKHAALETGLDMNLPAVVANAAHLRQILMNLITNASEAIGDRDGVIRVTSGRITVDRAAAVSKGVAEGEYLQLEVSDTGRGIPLEAQAKAFDPFFTTKAAGRGLGLSVVQTVVRNLRGAIHLASEPDKGTTFQVWLPFAETGAGATAGPARRVDAAEGASQEATVLVVEDEAPLREAVVKILRKKGFEVLEAANGSVAIDLLRAQSGKMDAILLDVTIPGASSEEVLAEAAQARPNLKVILTSAYSEEMVRATLSSPLIRDFIRKPFQLGDLLQRLRSLLSS